MLGIGLFGRTPRSRAGRVAANGSPPFVFDNAQIAAAGVWGISAEDNTVYGTQMAKYIPLDSMEILNDQAIDITVAINGGTDVRVLGNSARSWRAQKIRDIRITNTDGVNVIAANTIHVTIERAPLDADQIANIGARKWFR